MSTFCEFMFERQKLIDSGKLDTDTEKLSDFNRNKGIDECVRTSTIMARADRSDPFAYARIISHMKAGVSMPADYSARFDTEEVPSVMSQKMFPGSVERIKVVVPRNRSIPS